jgi:hypothetical protein
MKPTIYCYITSRGPDDVTTLALAEDGSVVAAHLGSSPESARADIGATSPLTPQGHDHHRAYGEHYPDGYSVEWVNDPSKHPGVEAARTRGGLL